MAFNFKPMQNKIPSAPGMAKMTVDPTKAPTVAKVSTTPPSQKFTAGDRTGFGKQWNEGFQSKSPLKTFVRKRG